MSRGRRCAAAALTIMLLAVAYAPSFRGAFVFDDQSEIVENRGLTRLWPLWVPMFSGGSLPHRPLPYLTFALNRAGGGLQVGGYHAVNLAIHVINGWLVWWIASRTIARAGGIPTVAAWLVATLWIVHPLCTQAVTYVYQRMELLAATAILAGLAAFIRSLSGKEWYWRAASLAACLLGGLCKETIVVLPPLICLYDLCFGGRKAEIVASRWRYYTGLSLTWLVVAAVVLGQRSRYTEFSSAEHWTAWEYASTQPSAILYYLSLALWPQNLCFDAGWAPVRDPSAIALAAVPLLLAAGAGLAVLRSHPAIAFHVLAFLLLLAPSSSLIPINDICVEHRMYLPLAVVVSGFVCAACQLFPRRIGVVAAAFIAVATSLAVVTSQRNMLYASPIDLWRDTVAKAPWNSRSRVKLARELLVVGQAAEAEAECRRAIEQHPDLAAAWAILADSLHDLGDGTAAAAAARRAIGLQATAAGPYATLQAIALAANRPSEAVAVGVEAIGVIPQIFDPLAADANRIAIVSNLGVAFGMIGDDRAVEVLRSALAMNPASPGGHYNLAMALAGSDPEAAAELFRRALSIDPSFTKARLALESLEGK